MWGVGLYATLYGSISFKFVAGVVKKGPHVVLWAAVWPSLINIDKA